MLTTSWSILAVPATLSIAASSQALFHSLQPGPLTLRESVFFNAGVTCSLVLYLRCSLTNPGVVPEDYSPPPAHRARWCLKCSKPKPPRAHHCKACGRCIPRMDHHCPWLGFGGNCVSNRTLPHFIRFLLYFVTVNASLEYQLLLRGAVLWENRRYPSYLGPSVPQLTLFVVLVLASSLILFAMTVLLVHALWSLATNVTTIEGWEMERHEALLRRARRSGGYLSGPRGERIRLKRQEFPYDVGVWGNLKQGMGTGNVLAWLWPLAASPPLHGGVEFETNGFEDDDVSWPPPDPDRMPVPRPRPAGSGRGGDVPDYHDAAEVAGFRERQRRDQARYAKNDGGLRERRRLSVRDFDAAGVHEEGDSDGGEEDGRSWRNAEGERLADFGVDEDVDVSDGRG